MALIFPRGPTVFTTSEFEYHPENENAVYQLSRNDVISVVACHLSSSLFRQPTADDEVATRLRLFSLSLVSFTASPMLSSISLTSSFILSIHFFGGLPLFLLSLI